jgi:hypothetical protein
MILPVTRLYGRVTGAGPEFTAKSCRRALLLEPGLPVWFGHKPPYLRQSSRPRLSASQ